MPILRFKVFWIFGPFTLWCELSPLVNSSQDINPPHSNMTSDTLKPVIPPFLPPPSFDLDSPSRPWRGLGGRSKTTMTGMDSSSSLVRMKFIHIGIRAFIAHWAGYFFLTWLAKVGSYSATFGHLCMHTSLLSRKMNIKILV